MEEQNEFLRPPGEDPAPVADSLYRHSVRGRLMEHWFKAVVGLVILLFGGLFLWLRSAQEQAQQALEPVAAASENIEQAIPEAATDRIESKSPTALLEQQRKAEQEAQTSRPAPAEQQVARAFALDTAGQGRRQHRPGAKGREDALAERGDDTPEPVARGKGDGPARSGKEGLGHFRKDAGDREGTTLSPGYDADGTPFETNPEVLRMLAASSPQTRRVYEQTTGRRFPDPGVGKGPRPGARPVPPGSDGFNTYRVTGEGHGAVEGGAPGPDAFYRCAVSGEQRVRTGSVVTMRLLEDAVISGVTFPRNTVFAGVAKVEASRLTLMVDRLGPARVKADIFDLNYMPGIMIDPERRVARDVESGLGDLQRQTGQEISTAIDRSASGANSVVGVAGRVAANIVSRPRTRQRQREVLLPDGYPIMLSPAAGGRPDPDGTR